MDGSRSSVYSSAFSATAGRRGKRAKAGLSGNNIVRDPGWDTTVGHTLFRAVIAGSQITFGGTGGQSGSDTTIALETIVPGTYQVTLAVVSTDDIGIRVALGGMSAASGADFDSQLTGGAQTVTANVVVTTVTNQTIVVSNGSADCVFDHIAVVRIA